MSVALRYDEKAGSVFGRDFDNHILEVSEEEAADLLQNPHWRRLDEFESFTHAQMKAAAPAVEADIESEGNGEGDQDPEVDSDHSAEGDGESEGTLDFEGAWVRIKELSKELDARLPKKGDWVLYPPVRE